LSCVEDPSNGASVVSPEALGAFISEEPIEMPTSTRHFLHLQNLGLNDNHCEVMAHEVARHDTLLRAIDSLDLTGNPSIGQQGYVALLGLLNRRLNVGTIVVDDLNWKSTFDLVENMNRKYRRRRFLENGVFPSKAMWVNFLAELSTDNDLNGGAHNLNAIWYTLREDPDLICN
jgi:hypothetical protein